jgi:hypothetical protein
MGNPWGAHTYLADRGIPLLRRGLSKAVEDKGRAAVVAATAQLRRTAGARPRGAGAMKR